jgi:hypothetical protein
MSNTDGNTDAGADTHAERRAMDGSPLHDRLLALARAWEQEAGNNRTPASAGAYARCAEELRAVLNTPDMDAPADTDGGRDH